jgi:D-aminoacyl-tRNA deacylase
VKIVIQRVSRARVEVAGATVGEIGHGLLALVGIGADDLPADATRLAAKICALRIFPSADGERPFDRNLGDVGGEVLIVSQFTLLGETRRGNRPSWAAAARPEVAEPSIDLLVTALRAKGVGVAVGTFGAHMQVSLTNDGPVTLVLE